MQTNFETAVAVRDFSDTSDKSRKRKIGVVVVSVIILVAAGVAIGVYFGLYSSTSSDGPYTRGLVFNDTLRASIDISAAVVRSASPLPTSIDWRTNGNIVSPIKNQQQCGSCWAFSTTDAIEAAYGLATGTTIQPVSVQQIISCDTGNGDQGCNGGDPAQALSGYLSKNALTSSHNYPYSTATAQGTTGTCDKTKAGYADSTLNWFPVQVDASKPVVYAVSPCSSSTCAYSSGSETALMTALTKGLVSICIDASGWNNYKGGVVDGTGSDTGKTTCTGANGAAASRSAIDHAVSVVGYNTASGVDYWIVRNQWGTSWGEKGYIYLKRGQNTCCILCEAIQTNVKPSIAAATTAAATTASPTAAKTTAVATTASSSTTTKSAATSSVSPTSTTSTTVAVATTAKPTTAVSKTTAAAVATTSSGACSLSLACTNPVSLTNANCPCKTTLLTAYTSYFVNNFWCSLDSNGAEWCCWAPITSYDYYVYVGITKYSTGLTQSVSCSYQDANNNAIAPPALPY